MRIPFLGSIPFVAVIGALLILANVVWIIPSLRDVERHASQFQLEVALRAKTEIDAFLGQNLDKLEGSARLLAREPANVEIGLKRFLRDAEHFTEVRYISGDGREIFRENRLRAVERTQITDVSGTELFQSARAGKVYVGPVFIAENLEPYLTLAVPVFLTEETVTAVLAADLRLRPLWEIVGRVVPSAAGRTYVVDGRGNLIADPDASRVLRGENYRTREIVRRVIEGKARADGLDPALRYRTEAGPVFAVGLPYERLGGGIFVEAPEQVAFEGKNRLTVLGFISIGSTVFLVSLLVASALTLFATANTLAKERDERSSIITNLADGLIAYDTDLRIQLVNPQAERMIRLSAKEVVGRVVGADLHADPKYRILTEILFPSLAQELQVLKDSGEYPKTVEISFREPYELQVQVVTVPVFREGGEIRGFLKIIRDISRERTIARMKSEFISIAAHQLRTPLSAVKWTLKMLLDGDLGALPPNQRDFLSKSYETNERMIQLINDLLDVARIEEGRFGYEFQPGDVGALLKTVVKGFETTARERGVALEFLPAASLPPAQFDPAKVRLLLENLLDNAVKYTSRGGRVSVSVKRKADAPFLEVSVADTGVGIPKAQQSRVFAKFFRGDNVMKLETQGSGLGLFIAKNIAKRHGGDLTFTSEERKGTTFTFTLPLEERLIPKTESPYEEFLKSF